MPGPPGAAGPEVSLFNNDNKLTVFKVSLSAWSRKWIVRKCPDALRNVWIPAIRGQLRVVFIKETGFGRCKHWQIHHWDLLTRPLSKTVKQMLASWVLLDFLDSSVVMNRLLETWGWNCYWDASLLCFSAVNVSFTGASGPSWTNRSSRNQGRSW